MRAACSIEGCGRPVRYSDGWCQRHHQRWKRNGDPLGIQTLRGLTVQFLNAAVQHQGDECLIWPYSKTTHGYGQITIGNKNQSVSRLVCERTNGPPIGDRNQSAHSCGNGQIGCVNPRHIYWATRLENGRDQSLHGKIPRGEQSRFAKVNRDLVLSVRALQGAQRSAEVAQQFGISQSHVNDIWARRSWRWL